MKILILSNPRNVKIEDVEKVIFFKFSGGFSSVNHHIWHKIAWFFNNFLVFQQSHFRLVEKDNG